MIIVALLILIINNGMVLADPVNQAGQEPMVNAGDGGTENQMVKLENDEIILNSAEINLEGEGLIEANGNVVLTIKNSGIRIETGQLIYNSESGFVKAPGKVKVTDSQAILFIDSLTYDLKNDTGSGGALEGTITKSDDGRDSSVTGKRIEIKNGKEIIKDTTVTRCPRPDSHYIFKARQVAMEGKKIRLSNVVLYIKGIPVFYLPQLMLHTDRKRDFPDIQVSYDNAKGIIIKEQSATAINDRLYFHTDLSIETLGDSRVSLGLGYQFTEPLVNHVFINTNLKGSWTISDKVTYNTKNFLVVADGAFPLSADNERQYGISVTRKYWRGWGGKWQLGVMARLVSKLDPTATEYGGTYAGYQLDYKPAENLTLSLLRLDNYAGTGDYKDFEVYTGLNLMYNWTVPLSASFDLNLSGRYNFNGAQLWSGSDYTDPQYWIRQKYELVYNTCCWSVNLGWEQALKSWNFGVVFKL